MVGFLHVFAHMMKKLAQVGAQGGALRPQTHTNLLSPWGRGPLCCLPPAPNLGVRALMEVSVPPLPDGSDTRSQERRKDPPPFYPPIPP